jgi:hypothetical protein
MGLVIFMNKLHKTLAACFRCRLAVAAIEEARKQRDLFPRRQFHYDVVGNETVKVFKRPVCPMVATSAIIKKID